MSLDEMYGALREPQRIDAWEVGRQPASLCRLEEPLASILVDHLRVSRSDLFSNAARSVTYLWAMDEGGEIIISVEELAETPDGRVVAGYPRRRNYPSHPADEKKLGHPTLLDGGLARVAGEFFIDEVDGNLYWFVNVSSGRYCRLMPPQRDQIDNVLDLFQRLIGPDVRLDDIRGT